PLTEAAARARHDQRRTRRRRVKPNRSTRTVRARRLRGDLPRHRLAQAVLARSGSYTSGVAEERKLVSVLFADIVGSTALGHGNDPEVVRAVLGRYFDRASEIVALQRGPGEKDNGE